MQVTVVLGLRFPSKGSCAGNSAACWTHVASTLSFSPPLSGNSFSLRRPWFFQPRSASHVANPPNLQTVFPPPLSTQLSQQTFPHLRLSVGLCCVGCMLQNHYPGGDFPIESDVIQNFSSVSKGTISCILWREIKRTLHLGNRMIPHRFSRPLGNYSVIILKLVFLSPHFP